VPVKGPVLARSAHGDVALRPSADLDVMVDPADLEAAIRVLAVQGYGAPCDRRRTDGRPELHLAVQHATSARPRIEMHWRIHWNEERHGAAMVGRAEPDQDGTLRLAAADELAVVLLCYARDGFVGVRLASDLAGWWDRRAQELEDRALEALATEHPQLAPVLAAAALVAADVAGLPAERLLAPKTLALAPAAATRFADPVAAADRSQLRAQTTLVEWALLPRDEWRAFVRRRMQWAREAERLSDRVLHLPKLGARCAWAALRGPAGTGRMA
jgi:hypothetical protein